MKRYEYLINGKRFVVDLLSFDGRKAEVRVNNTPFRVELTGTAQPDLAPTPVSPPSPAQPEPPRQEPISPPTTSPAPVSGPAVPSSEDIVVAPMPGIILSILVQEGDLVSEGDSLLILEAMKMENEIRAPRTGRIKKIHVSEGTEVRAGSRLVEIE